MIEIIVLFSLISLLAVLLVFAPLKHFRLSSVDSKNQNTSLFLAKKNELEDDKHEGLISADEFAVLLRDLEKSLLVDVPEQSKTPIQSRNNKPWLVFWVLFIPLMSFGYYFTVPSLHSHRAAFDWIALKAAFAEAMKDASVEGGALPGALDSLSMADFIRLLQADLQQNNPRPEQAASGWYLLGASYLKVKNFDSALYALKKADDLEPGREDVRFNYAQALIFKNQGRHTDESRVILAHLLANSPDHQRALMLSGVAAFNDGDYATAIAQWQRLLKLRQTSAGETHNDINSEGLEVLQASIASAKKKLSENQAQGVSTKGSSTPVVQHELGIKVELASALQKQLTAGDSLFVFVKASSGPNMPLAVVRYTNFKLPKIVYLDDKSAMSPEFKLSDFDEVIVTARITKQGKAQLLPGDMEGVTGIIKLKPGLSKVSVIIDHLQQ